MVLGTEIRLSLYTIVIEIVDYYLSLSCGNLRVKIVKIQTTFLKQEYFLLLDRGFALSLLLCPIFGKSRKADPGHPIVK